MSDILEIKDNKEVGKEMGEEVKTPIADDTNDVVVLKDDINKTSTFINKTEEVKKPKMTNPLLTKLNQTISELEKFSNLLKPLIEDDLTNTIVSNRIETSLEILKNTVFYGGEPDEINVIEYSFNKDSKVALNESIKILDSYIFQLYDHLKSFSYNSFPEIVLRGVVFQLYTALVRLKEYSEFVQTKPDKTDTSELGEATVTSIDELLK